MSTSYPEEAAMFDRKARELADANGIADVERALEEIFGHRPARPAQPPPPPSSAPPPHGPWGEDEEPLEFDTMIGR